MEHYESDTTQFLRSLLKQHPDLEDKQRKGRAQWWDRPQKFEQIQRYQSVRVYQRPYVFQSYVTPPSDRFLSELSNE